MNKVKTFKLNNMDLSIDENKKVTPDYFEYLGFKNHNGAFVKDGIEGEFQFNGEWFYCIDNKAVKKIVTRKELNDIYIKQTYNLKD